MKLKKYISLPIGNSDLVLELGSGNNPHPRSNVLVDKFYSDNNQREANLPIVSDRLLIIADACNLPFKDKSFDYVIASHILEHVNDPAAFIKEITRVSKNGYLETPGILRERVFNWSFHKWYVDVKDGTLLLTRKTKKGEILRYRILKPLELELLTFLEGKKLLNCSLLWRGNITYKISNEESNEFLSRTDIHLQKLINQDLISKSFLNILWLVRKIYLKTYILPNLREIFRRLIHNISQSTVKGEYIKLNLSEFLVCPKCHTNLITKKQEYFCKRCNYYFSQVKKGVYNFLIKK